MKEVIIAEKCIICKGPVLEWRTSKTKKAGLLEVCSRHCQNKLSATMATPQHNRNLKAFEDWVRGDSFSGISLEGLVTKGDMKYYLKLKIKEYLLNEQGHKCSICGQEDNWNEKPFTMILDHIDGNPTNHLKSNLRLICPICDSQLDTYGSRNYGKGRYSERMSYYRKKRGLENLQV